MAYIVPQALVYQEFQLAPAAASNPLSAFIAGPNYQLVRYAHADEKSNGALGSYDSANDTSYAWPHRVAGAAVDQAWTKLFVDNAILEYYSKNAGSGSTVEVSDDGYKNHITASSINWVSYGSYPRSVALGNRDVKVGDWITLSASVSSVIYTHETYVAGFIHTETAADVGSATSDSGNVAASSSSFAATHESTETTDISLVVGSTNAYDPLSVGITEDTYLFTVTTAGAPGTAILSYTTTSGSESGSIAPSAFATDITVGSLGLKIKFTHTSDVFVADQQWSVAVATAYTKAAATSGGGFTGPSDATYIIKVTRGNKFAESVKPQITVSTSTGIDIGGPYTVTAASTPVTIGNFTTTVEFSGSGLVLNDRFYIPVTAAAPGAVNTIVLGKNLPAELIDTTPDMNVKLAIKKNAEIPATSINPGVSNFDTSATEITVKSGIELYDASWLDNSGNMLPLTLKAGDLFVQYRAFLPTYVGEISSISDVSEIPAVLGKIDPDNDLAYAVSKAVANSNGTPILFSAVADNSVESYSAVLDSLLERNDVYSLVPLTTDVAVQQLFASHVSAMSTPENGLWRITFVNTPAPSAMAIVSLGTSDDVILATVSDDPLTSGTQYTFVELTSTDVALVSAGAKAGDVLRVNYSTDGFGNVTYEEYVIDEVLSEDSLRLVAPGLSAAISVPSKIEVWRNLDAQGIAGYIGRAAGAFASRRVYNIWPDSAVSAGVTVAGYHLCAAIAGVVSGVVPHQGLTNVSIAGFDAVPRTTQLLNITALNTMAADGVFIITQNPSGTIYTRHELSTDPTDLNTRELMVTKNVDSISYLFLAAIAPFIGISNVTPDLIAQIGTELAAVAATLRTGYLARLGPQLIEMKVNSIGASPILKDRIVASVSLTIPYVLNNLELHLVI